MTTPTVFQKYIINNDIEGNKSVVEIMNNTIIDIHRTQAMQKKCTRKYCDPQISHEILNQICGCWGTSVIGITNLSI